MAGKAAPPEHVVGKPRLRRMFPRDQVDMPDRLAVDNFGAAALHAGLHQLAVHAVVAFPLLDAVMLPIESAGRQGLIEPHGRRLSRGPRRQREQA